MQVRIILGKYEPIIMGFKKMISVWYCWISTTKVKFYLSLRYCLIVSRDLLVVGGT
jgi:hypothetical protein